MANCGRHGHLATGRDEELRGCRHRPLRSLGRPPSCQVCGTSRALPPASDCPQNDAGDADQTPPSLPGPTHGRHIMMTLTRGRLPVPSHFGRSASPVSDIAGGGVSRGVFCAGLLVVPPRSRAFSVVGEPVTAQRRPTATAFPVASSEVGRATPRRGGRWAGSRGIRPLPSTRAPVADGREREQTRTAVRAPCGGYTSGSWETRARP